MPWLRGVLLCRQLYPPASQASSTQQTQGSYTRCCTPAPLAASCFFTLPLTVQDNGMGMAHKDIPNLLGRVLSGTKYGVQQTRGKFGLGAKMALIWSKMSTGLPIEVRSSTSRHGSISYYKLDIDIHK